MAKKNESFLDQLYFYEMHKINARLEGLIHISAGFISESTQGASWCCRRKIRRAFHESQIEFYNFSRKLCEYERIYKVE
jgi:hypothetical protein